MPDVKGRKKIILKFNLDDFKKMKMIDDFFTITGNSLFKKSYNTRCKTN